MDDSCSDKKSYYYTDQEQCGSISEQQKVKPTSNHTFKNQHRSQYARIYHQYFQDVQVIPFTKIRSLLKDNFIQFKQNSNCLQLAKSCTKTDWESSNYIVKIGNLQGNLTVLRLNFDHKVFYKNKIGGGQYGEVFQYRTLHQNYAIKCIRIQECQKKLNAALGEVFISKIASALHIGPKFYNLFGYDAIIFKGSLQFVMEMCEPTQSRTHALLEKDLKANLKILHSLQFCHLDIKSQNIAWSSVFSKFIFIDFGFCKFIEEPIGFKSPTKFIGTYAYSAPEMKKLYFLKERSCVDLYYNDLYCLNLSLKQLKAPLSLSQSENIFVPQMQFQLVQLQAISLEQHLNISQQERAKFLKIFANFKYYLFFQRFDQIEDIINQSGNIALFTMKRVLTCLNSTNPHSSKIQPILSLISKKQFQVKKVGQMDAVFLDYVFRCSTEMFFKDSFSKLLQISKAVTSKQFIRNIWLNESWMADIFYFLDVYSRHCQDISQPRKKLISKLHNFIFQTSGTSITMQFRKVLLELFDFFVKAENISIMSQIQTYFVILNDGYNQDRMEVAILELYSKGNNPILYILKNLQFFFGKMLVASKMSYLQNSNNLINLENLHNQQIKHQSFCEFSQFLKDSITALKLVKQQFSYFYESIPEIVYHSFGSYYLSKYGTYLTADIKILVDCFFFQKDNIFRQYSQESFLNLNLENQYLRNCLFKTKALFLIQNYELERVKILTKSQPFCSQFHTEYGIENQKLGKITIQMICLDVTQIMRKHCFNLTQHILHAMFQELKPKILFEFLLKYVKQSTENYVKSIGDVITVCNAFYRLLCCLFHSELYKFQQSYALKIAEQIQQFLVIALKNLKTQYSFKSIIQQVTLTSSYQQILKDLSRNSSNLLKNDLQDFHFQFEQNQQELIYYLQYLIILNTSMIYRVKNQKQKSVKKLVQLLQLTSQTAYIVHICNLYEMVNPQLRLFIEQALSRYLMKIISKKKFDILIFTSALLSIAVIKYKQDRGHLETFKLFATFAEYIYDKNVNITNAGFFQASSKYVNLCTQKEAQQILTNIIILKKLQSFKRHFFISVMIFELYLKSKHIISGQCKKRILVLCAFYAKQLTQGLFQAYKLKLSSQLTELKISNQTTQSFHCKKYNFRKQILNKFQRKLCKKLCLNQHKAERLSVILAEKLESIYMNQKAL